MRMRKWTSLMLTCCLLIGLLMGVTPAFGAQITEGDWKYTPNGDGTCTLDTYTGSSTVLAIPSELGGCRVTVIGEGAFFCLKSLTGVTIPSSVTTIGKIAFCQTGLTSVSIPSSVTTIGEDTFEACTVLTSVVLPNSVTTIGKFAFANCRNLESITIPNNVASIENGAFSQCFKLKSVIIPSSVTTIGNAAFSQCDDLKSVTIPSSVASIENGAFLACSILNKIYFDGAPTTVASGAFSGPLITFCSSKPLSINGINCTTLPVQPVTTGPAINGTITPSTSQGMVGETISLNIQPNAGYTLDQGSLKYNDGTKDVPITGDAFVMPGRPVVVSGTFKAFTAPVLTAASGSANPLKWNWMSSGGLGSYRYKLTTPTVTPVNWSYTLSNSFESTALVGGDYTLEVQEGDAYGGWSPSGSATVTVDKIKPAFSLTAPVLGSTVPITTNQLELTFSETVTAASAGILTLSDGVNAYICQLADRDAVMSGTGSNCKATLPLSRFVKAGGTGLVLNYSKTYTLSVSAGAFADPSGNLTEAVNPMGSFTTESPVYKVLYSGNGNTSGTTPSDTSDYHNNDGVTVLGNPGNLVRTGYTFVGWNTKVDGKGTSYTAGKTFNMGIGDVTLYALWTAVPPVTPPTPPPVVQPSGSTGSSKVSDSDRKITSSSPATELVTTSPSLPQVIIPPQVPVGPVALPFDVQTALDKAIAAKTQTLVLPVKEPAKAKGLQLQIDSTLVKAMKKAGIKQLVFKNGQGSYSFDEKTLSLMEKWGSQSITFMIERKDSKSALKNKTTFKIHLSVVGGTVRVTVPYALAKGEKPTDLQLYLINKSGKEERIRGITYDSKGKTVGFLVK